MPATDRRTRRDSWSKPVAASKTEPPSPHVAEERTRPPRKSRVHSAGREAHRLANDLATARRPLPTSPTHAAAKAVPTGCARAKVAVESTTAASTQCP